ncbi:hypothetical protein [uncultured Aquimarina sp.]|uniref:hypothetical protein n=1 Tax=uncultured Aquimarina sp. TaxID=575652 RepID=UPI0026095646|nr:hypothetical protein [uncultured Aquimarina sp.]
MTLYYDTINNEFTYPIIESNAVGLFDLETVIPIEIGSILELYEYEIRVTTLKLRERNLGYDISKIGSISA